MRNEYTKHKNALMKLLLNGVRIPEISVIKFLFLQVENFSQQTDILFQVQDIQNTLEVRNQRFWERMRVLIA